LGPSGQIVGTDIDEEAARSFLEAEGISKVALIDDDLFESQLEPQSFDLVHARYLLAPLGRGREQGASHRRSRGRISRAGQMGHDLHSDPELEQA
jgi:hypothetical protein